MGWCVRASTGMVPRRKSAPNSVNSMPRCEASSPAWLERASSMVGLANQMAMLSSRSPNYRACAPVLLAESVADAPVGFAERDALANHQRVGFLGGVYRGVEFDAIGAETHAVHGLRHDGRGGQRQVDAAEQRRLDEPAIALG